MIPEWVDTDFVRSLNVSGTGLKAYGASIGGIKTWMLKGKSKIYKDRYGWIRAEWSIHLPGGRQCEGSLPGSPAAGS